MTDWMKMIDEIRKHVKTDPDLVAYIIRDWEITQEAGLYELVCAMRQGAYVPVNEAKWLLDELEKHVRAGESDGD